MGKDRFLKILCDHPLLWGAFLFASGFTPSGTANLAIGQVPRDLKLSQFPNPPQQLQQLIAAGDVSFKIGTRVDSGDPRIVGETRYDMSYTYKSQSNLNLLRDEQGGRVLLINVRFSRMQWKSKHVIWLRDQLAAEGFWSNPILLHEFDHVRISTDPRVAKRFSELMKKRTVIRHQLQPGEVAGRELADKLVEREVRSVFEELTELIAIRYLELDRETVHGQRPLPRNSNLHNLLRPASAEVQPEAANAASASG